MARSIWLRQERAGRGPAPEHSRAELAAAAIALADAGGLDAVSMRKVATVVGTGAASLYRYVENREELIELMTDAAVGEIDLSRPLSGDWRADLLALGHAMRAVYRRHPWLLDVIAGRTSFGPRAVDVLERGLAAMAPLDRPAGRKMEAFALLNAFVTLLTRTELAVGGATAEHQQAQAEFLASVAVAGRHPHLAAAFAEPTPSQARDSDLLDGVLPRLLTGLLDTEDDHH